MLEPKSCYRAVKARDRRFDGCFFVAVKTTRIYCRPICTVKSPKFENCLFFANAAAAETEGFRPCLRCRPELAPGNAKVDASNRLARAAVHLIEEGGLREGEIAERLNVTARHLRRTFQNEWGVSPVSFAQTHRLLLAKQFLTDTRMSVTDVAFAAGFGSLRRMNALFRERYRLTPSQVRRTQRRSVAEDALNFELSFRPPYAWPAFLEFLGARCIAGVEEVDGLRYGRIVRVRQDGVDHIGRIELSANAEKPSLRLSVGETLIKVLPIVLTRMKSFTDVAANPYEISKRLGKLGLRNPGLRVPGTFDGFEIAIRAILGQQVSLKAARTLLARLVERFGTKEKNPRGSLRFAFPLAEDIAQLHYADIAALGMPQTRAVSVIEMARAVASGFVSLHPGADVDSTSQKLKTLPGIGEWTTQYIAMRALNWPDAFPHTDLVLMRAMGEKIPRKVLAAAECWRPWRSYAVMHLWSGGGESDGSLSRSA